MSKIDFVVKRDFSTKKFELDKITNAILKAMTAVDHGTKDDAQNVALGVYKALQERKTVDVDYIPTIEEIQDNVETTLMAAGFLKAAKALSLIHI